MGLDLSYLAGNPDFSESICACCNSLSNLDKFSLKVNKNTCEVCGYHSVYESATELKSYVFDEVFEMANSLEALKQVCDEPKYHFTNPWNALFELLTKASRFIHICTYSFDVPMLYALRVLSINSPNVPIRIIFNKNISKSWLLEEVERSKRFDSNIHIYQVPDDHQKLILVDGLVAITGSPNLTTSAWKQLERHKEKIEFESDVTKVREINNKFFSPTIKEWRDITNKPYTPMEDLPF